MFERRCRQIIWIDQGKKVNLENRYPDKQKNEGLKLVSDLSIKNTVI
jgi:hypothetical protein